MWIGCFYDLFFILTLVLVLAGIELIFLFWNLRITESQNGLDWKGQGGSREVILAGEGRAYTWKH